MADTKISALPASSTPLAGTEVLPIVQSSTTVKVSVANLTAGRAVATGALTVTGTMSATTGAAVGGATAGAGGLAFPATAVAVANANTLDDYEEGTFTPTITAGYSGITYGEQVGWYVKTGNMVIVSCRIYFSGTATGGFITMSCPFTQGPTGYGSGGIPYCSVVEITNTFPYITEGSNSVVFYTTGAATIISSINNVTNKYLSYVIAMAVS